MKLKDICILQKVPLLTGEKLKTLNCNDGVVKLLSAGKFNGYTTKEKSNNLFTNGDIIAISRGGSFNIKYYNGYFCSANNYILKTNSKVYTKYLYHYLLNYKDVIECFYTGWGCKRLNIHSFLNLNCTLTNIDKQKEIVRILDTLTTHTAELTAKLTAELTAELTARKKQYEYYRNQLLTFGDGVEWKKLGEVAKIQRGASPRPINKYITEGDGVSWIKIGDTASGTKYINKTAQKITHDGAKQSRLLKKGDFILSNSMSFGRPYILDIDGAIHDGWASISNFDNYLIGDYLYHFLSSDGVQNYWETKINSSSVDNLNSDIIKSLPIPLPPLVKQKEIVEILDKFDALTTSITNGLPREIDLRKKQYEYYRNQLLNFKEL